MLSIQNVIMFAKVLPRKSSFQGQKQQINNTLVSLSLQLRSMTQASASTKSPLLHHLRSTSSSSPIPSMHHSRDSTEKLQTPSPTDNSRSSAHSTVQSSQTLNSADRGLIYTAEKTTVSLLQPTRASTVETQRTTAEGASLWIQHLRGYVILRDLERYLSRLARDYTVLQAKY